MQITLETIRAAAGPTYFEFSDEYDHISLDTRRNGSIYDETPGKKDIEEANRLLKLIQKTFPKGKFKITAGTCDEWVSITARKEPLTKKEKLIAKQKKERAKIAPKIKEITDNLKAQGHDPLYLYYDNGYNAEYNPYKTPKLEIVVKFGKVVTALYTKFRYKDEQEAETAALAAMPLITGIPINEWKKIETRPLYTKTALDGSGRVLDISSEVRFETILIVSE
jgi:hypothetical protein